jgi:hypothetical protein
MKEDAVQHKAKALSNDANNCEEMKMTVGPTHVRQHVLIEGS